SPLDLALKARQARRDGGLLGLRRDGLLVPETVPWPEAPDGIVEVGRFEVTRAQYAAFDSSYGVTEATANLPASGIGFDKATAYCDWLSARTGERFRLPTISESRALLARTAGDPLGEVTLDYWAGFALNP